MCFTCQETMVFGHIQFHPCITGSQVYIDEKADVFYNVERKISSIEILLL